MITKIPIEIIRIENEGYHLIIKGKINKKVSNLIIDTGASRSVFSNSLSGIRKGESAYLNQTDLSTTSLLSDEIPSVNGIINEFQVGALRKSNYEATFIDIEYINKLYNDSVGKTIDGLIGNDLLIKHQAIIDFLNSMLVLTY